MWQLKSVHMELAKNDDELDDLLTKGWEPYAVTVNKYGVITHWLRRN